MLKAMGIEDDKVDQIIDAHTETVDALKEARDNYKVDAEKLPNIQKELEELKAKGDDGWKDKHDKLKGDFDTYKKGVEAKEARAAKEAAYRSILKDANLSDKGVDKAIKYAEWDKIELDTDGKLKGASDLVKAVKEEWAEYVTTTTTTGANTAKPPASTGGSTMSMEEIYKMENGRYVLSASERQAELAKIYQNEKGER